jgi:hypothetical protein
MYNGGAIELLAGMTFARSMRSKTVKKDREPSGAIAATFTENKCPRAMQPHSDHSVAGAHASTIAAAFQKQRLLLLT